MISDSTPHPQARTVVFDIGGVLLDWNPRYLFRQLFAGDEQAMEYFLTHVCSHTWNLMQDAGRPFSDAVSELSARFPDHAAFIEAYDKRWEEMVSGAIEESVTIFETLLSRGVPVYAITNFSAEKFELCLNRFTFLRRFHGTVVSGAVRLIKPDPAIYLRLLQDHDLSAGECVFIDDQPNNVRGAQAVGMHGIHFQSPAQLQNALSALKLL